MNRACDIRVFDHHWKPCKYLAVLKCRACDAMVCSDHQHRIGFISAGVAAFVCKRCYKHFISAKFTKKVSPNLCCVLNKYATCYCGNSICNRCWDSKAKPHQECEFLKCKAIISQIKKSK